MKDYSTEERRKHIQNLIALEKRGNQHIKYLLPGFTIGLQEFPEQCGFVVDDRVIYTNGYGVSFDIDVIRFSKDANFYDKY